MKEGRKERKGGPPLNVRPTHSCASADLYAEPSVVVSHITPMDLRRRKGGGARGRRKSLGRKAQEDGRGNKRNGGRKGVVAAAHQNKRPWRVPCL